MFNRSCRTLLVITLLSLAFSQTSRTSIEGVGTQKDGLSIATIQQGTDSNNQQLTTVSVSKSGVSSQQLIYSQRIPRIWDIVAADDYSKNCFLLGNTNNQYRFLSLNQNGGSNNVIDVSSTINDSLNPNGNTFKISSNCDKMVVNNNFYSLQSASNAFIRMPAINVGDTLAFDQTMTYSLTSDGSIRKYDPIGEYNTLLEEANIYSQNVTLRSTPNRLFAYSEQSAAGGIAGTRLSMFDIGTDGSLTSRYTQSSTRRLPGDKGHYLNYSPDFSVIAYKDLQESSPYTIQKYLGQNEGIVTIPQPAELANLRSSNFPFNMNLDPNAILITEELTNQAQRNYLYSLSNSNTKLQRVVDLARPSLGQHKQIMTAFPSNNLVNAKQLNYNNVGYQTLFKSIPYTGDVSINGGYSLVNNTSPNIPINNFNSVEELRNANPQLLFQTIPATADLNTGEALSVQKRDGDTYFNYQAFGYPAVQELKLDGLYNEVRRINPRCLLMTKGSDRYLVHVDANNQQIDSYRVTDLISTQAFNVAPVSSNCMGFVSGNNMYSLQDGEFKQTTMNNGLPSLSRVQNYDQNFNYLVSNDNQLFHRDGTKVGEVSPGQTTLKSAGNTVLAQTLNGDRMILRLFNQNQDGSWKQVFEKNITAANTQVRSSDNLQTITYKTGINGPTTVINFNRASGMYYDNIKTPLQTQLESTGTPHTVIPQDRAIYVRENSPSNANGILQQGFYTLNNDQATQVPVQTEVRYSGQNLGTRVLANGDNYQVNEFFSLNQQNVFAQNKIIGPSRSYLLNGVYYPCQGGCLSCTAQGCSDCNRGFQITRNGCVTCPSNCLTCNSNGVCSSCASGFYLNANTCLKCKENCVSCSSASTCTRCVDGMFSLDNVCTSCISGCQQCTSNTVCNTCRPGYTLTGNGQSCCKCPTSCHSCNQNTGGCTGCIQGYRLHNNSCHACSSKCLSCTTSECITCMEGYHLYNGRCMKNCAYPCANCLSTDSSVCSTCWAGFSLSNGKCQVDNGCNSNQNCVACASTYYLNSGKCERCQDSDCKYCAGNEGQTCLQCQYGYYVNEDNGCTRCSNNCSSCTSQDLCLSCDSGYYLKNNRCVRCQSPCDHCSKSGICTTCLSGWTRKGLSCTSSRCDHQVQVHVNFTSNYNLGYCALSNSFINASGVSSDRVHIDEYSGSSIPPMGKGIVDTSKVSEVKNNLNGFLDKANFIKNRTVKNCRDITPGSVDNSDNLLLAILLPVLSCCLCCLLAGLCWKLKKDKKKKGYVTTHVESERRLNSDRYETTPRTNKQVVTKQTIVYNEKPKTYETHRVETRNQPKYQTRVYEDRVDHRANDKVVYRNEPVVHTTTTKTVLDPAFERGHQRRGYEMAEMYEPKKEIVRTTQVTRR